MDRETDPSFPPINIDDVIPVAPELYGVGSLGSPPNQVKKTEDTPYSVKDLGLGAVEAVPFALTSMGAVVAGPIYGILKNFASGKYGTQEGIRIADEAASEMMQKLTYEPESKSLTDLMSTIEDIAVKYKLDAALPQLLTVPIPGPASGQYAKVKSAEALDDVIEDQYLRQQEAQSFGKTSPLDPVRDILLPPRKQIFIGKTAKNWDNDSVKTFEQAEREILAQNPNISYYDLNKQSWERTAQMVKNGELKYPTFRGYDGKLRQEIGDKKSVIINQDFRVVRGANDPVSKDDLQNMLFGSSESGLNPEFEKMLLAEGATLEKVKRDVASLKGMFEDKKDELDPYVATKVAHVIDHPELFDNYSDLMDFILTQEFDKGTRGYFRAPRIGEEGKINVSPIEPDPRKEIFFGAIDEDPETGRETFNQKVIADEFRSTLLHEIQHYIQNKNGFARGAGTDQESKTVILDGLNNIRYSIRGRREGTIALNKNSEKIFNKPLSEIPIQDEIAYMRELGRQARVAERMFYLDEVIENLEKGYRIQPRLFDDILKTYNYIDSSNPVSIKVDKVNYGDLAKRQTVQKIPEAEKTYYGRRYRQRNYDLRTQHNLDTLRNLKEMLLGKGETKPLENYGAIYEEPPVSQKNQKAIYFKNRTEAKNAIQRVNNYGKRPELAAYNSLDTIEKEIIKVTDEVKKQNKLDSNFYYRTLGELEPRLVQSRRNLTATERLNEFPLDTARLVKDPILSPSGKKFRYDSGEVYADYTKLYKDIPTRSFEGTLLSKQYIPRFGGLESDEDITAFLRANLAPKIFKGFEKLKYERDPYGSDVDVQPFLGRKPDEDIEMRSASKAKEKVNIPKPKGKTLKNVDSSMLNLVQGQWVKWKEPVFEGSFKKPKYVGDRTLSGTIQNESYGTEKGQHTFTILLDSREGVNANQYLDGEKIRRKGRNLYPNVQETILAEDTKRKELIKNIEGLGVKISKASARMDSEGVDRLTKERVELQKQLNKLEEKEKTVKSLRGNKDIEMRSALPPSDPEPRPVEKNELGLSSKLLETTKGLKQRKGTAAQLLGQLKKTLGKENKEIKDSGIEEFLADKKKINVDEIEEFIKKNQPKFVERVGKGESAFKMEFGEGVKLTPAQTYWFGDNYIDERANELISFEAEDGKTLNYDDAVKMAEKEYYDDPIMKYVDSKTGYTITGNDNLGYSIFETELESNSWKNAFATSGGRKRYDMRRDESGDLDIYSLDEAKVQARGLFEESGEAEQINLTDDTRWADQTEPGGENYQELRLALDKDRTLFTEGTHFPDDKNNILHVRTTDRVYDGTQDEGVPKPEKVLYVEELQSDWAQTGRNEGFKLTKEEAIPIVDNTAKNLADAEKIFNEMMDGFGNKNQNLFNYFNEPLSKSKVNDFVRSIGKSKITNTFTFPADVSSKIENTFFNEANPESLTRKNIMKAVFKETKKSAFNEAGVRVSETGKHNLITGYIGGKDFPPRAAIKEIYRMTDEIAQITKIIKSNLRNVDKGSEFSEAAISIRDLGESNYSNLKKLRNKLPKAPFVTNTDSWTQLGIKKLLTKAVDEGYDYVSFSPGHVQYNRWGKKNLEEYYDKIIPKNAKKVVDKIDKEAIVKLDGNRFKTEDGEGLDADESVPNPFYDSEELDFPEPEYGAILPRFSIKITPKLKEKILKEGLPLYKKGGEVSKGTATIIELMKR